MRTLSLMIILIFTQAIGLFAFSQEGVASWYGGKFHGRKTANGETYNMYEMTAAHKSLPFGTIVNVHNLDNGKVIRVRINDRGPFIKDRIIDLSKKAADDIGMSHSGTANVKLTVDDPAITNEFVDKEKLGLMTIQIAAYKNPLNAKRMKEKIAQANLNPVAVLTQEGVIRIEVRSIHKNDVEKALATLEGLGISSTVVKQQL
ncbi:MAG: septal ring lytic transglycosylase RlpA family protein [Spirochaetia bacterium]